MCTRPPAILIGDVLIGARCYVGPAASLRGDFGRLVLEDGSNLQDTCVMHGFPGTDTVVEVDGHIGHRAVLHGCRIGRNALVGMNAVVMDNAIVGESAIIAACAFVKAGLKIPPRMLAADVPARVIRPVTEQELAWKIEGTRTYQALTRRSAETMREVAPLREAEPNRPRLALDSVQPLGGLQAARRRLRPRFIDASARSAADRLAQPPRRTHRDSSPAGAGCIRWPMPLAPPCSGYSAGSRPYTITSRTRSPHWVAVRRPATTGRPPGPGRRIRASPSSGMTPSAPLALKMCATTMRLVPAATGGAARRSNAWPAAIMPSGADGSGARSGAAIARPNASIAVSMHRHIGLLQTSLASSASSRHASPSSRLASRPIGERLR